MQYIVSIQPLETKTIFTDNIVINQTSVFVDS